MKVVEAESKVEEVRPSLAKEGGKYSSDPTPRKEILTIFH